MSFQYTTPKGLVTETRTIFFSSVKVLIANDGLLEFYCKNLGKITVHTHLEKQKEAIENFKEYLRNRQVYRYVDDNAIVVLGGIAYMNMCETSLDFSYDDGTVVNVKCYDKSYLKSFHNGIIHQISIRGL